MLPLAFLRMTTTSMQMPVYVDIITRMACSIHRPDIAVEFHVPGTGRGLFDTYDLINFADTPSNHTLCARDPHVQRAVSSVLASAPGSVPILRASLTCSADSAHVPDWHSHHADRRLVGPGSSPSLHSLSLCCCADSPVAQKSDLWGRTRTLTVAVVALAARCVNIAVARPLCLKSNRSELNMIFVARSITWLPGKAYWFLIPGSAILGILGGPSLPSHRSCHSLTSHSRRERHRAHSGVPR